MLENTEISHIWSFLAGIVSLIAKRVKKQMKNASDGINECAKAGKEKGVNFPKKVHTNGRLQSVSLFLYLFEVDAFDIDTENVPASN